MTEDEQIAKIERDRRKREAALFALLLLLADQARRFAAYSVRTGNDPIEAIRNVVLGNPQLHLPGAAPTIASAMSEAAEAGFARAFKIAGVEDMPQYSPGLYYLQAANETAARMLDSMTRIAWQALSDGIAAGRRTGQIANDLLQAFTRYGWSRHAPQTVNPESKGSAGYSAIGTSTDAILSGWSGGFWNGMNHPAVDVKLAGFKHVSVLDHRTSEICIERGEPSHQYRKDDPYWLNNVVPLHPRCRSVILPLFGAGHDWTEGYPIIPPAPGFGRAPELLFGYRFRPAA